MVKRRLNYQVKRSLAYSRLLDSESHREPRSLASANAHFTWHTPNLQNRLTKKDKGKLTFHPLAVPRLFWLQIKAPNENVQLERLNGVPQ
jgi:hypothetical protein